MTVCARRGSRGSVFGRGFDSPRLHQCKIIRTLGQSVKGSDFLFPLEIKFLYKGIIIKHNKTEPTYTKTSLFLYEKRRFFMAGIEKGVVLITYLEKEGGKYF